MGRWTASHNTLMLLCVSQVPRAEFFPGGVVTEFQPRGVDLFKVFGPVHDGCPVSSLVPTPVPVAVVDFTCQLVVGRERL